MGDQYNSGSYSVPGTYNGQSTGADPANGAFNSNLDALVASLQGKFKDKALLDQWTKTGRGADADYGKWSMATGLSVDELKTLNRLMLAQSNPDARAQLSSSDLSALMAKYGGQPGAPSTDDIMGKLDSFYKQLMGPLPDNDPTAQYIQRHAVNAAQRYGGAAGMNGRSTLGAGAAAAQYTSGAQAYDFQRKQLAAQVGGLMNQRDLGLKELQLGYDKFQADLADKQWAAQQNQNQGIGSAIGAGLMAIPGVALAPYTGGASLGLIGAGATIGGGLGGLASGGSGPSYRPSRGIGNYGTGY